MQSALRLEATVLPGHRLEISAPELPEGAKVEVIVVLPEKPQPRFASALEFLESLPPGRVRPTDRVLDSRGPMSSERRASSWPTANRAIRAKNNTGDA